MIKIGEICLARINFGRVWKERGVVCLYWRIGMSFVWNRQVRKGIKYPLENCLHFHVVSLGMLLPRMILSFFFFLKKRVSIAVIKHRCQKQFGE